jgi:HEAT repeat protein
VGEEPRPVRSHVFPASRSEKQLRRAYQYEAGIDGDHVLVRITNKGAGHNFPTELKQRSVESLIVVRDREGNEVARSRMVFRDPYKRPYGLELPVNTQIPAGQTREHRVPLTIADGYVDCELHYKLYFPIEDNHPELARQLEARRLPFAGIAPSTEPVLSEPEVGVVLPEGIAVEAASPADLVDYARPAIAAVAVDIPEGDDAAAVAQLIALFQFPVPEANAKARDRLTRIGAAAVPALVEALGSWDNKTFKQAQKVLERIGAPAEAAVVAALSSENLYVRHHARELVARMRWSHGGAAVSELAKWLDAANAIDRADAADTLAALAAHELAPRIRPLLADPDPDVVRAAARALARIDDRAAAAAMAQAMQAAPWVETRIDLAQALAALGSPEGIPVLLAALDHHDDLIREDAFEALFAVSSRHMGFVPLAPRPERLESLARLQTAWAESGGSAWLRPQPAVDHKADAKAFHLVEELGGGTGLVPAGDDDAILAELAAMGEGAVPALVRGLKFPPGFALKRSKVCEALGRIGSRGAAPALVATLHDPVVSVAAWACFALSTCGDDECLPALQRWRDRVRSLAAAGRLPQTAGSRDVLLAQAAGTRFLLGEKRAQGELAELLLAEDPAARRAAIDALVRGAGDARGYDPDAPVEERFAAAARWLEQDRR